ncbi:hypothetical protein [Arenimonas sp.]|uniref:hypothetical protein n=1 Tax=Arenimonas sp. TaxID=1872635 RepID=UPI0039E213C4
MNMAALQKTQRNEEASERYDRGIGYEALHTCVFVAESKVDLHHRVLNEESLCTHSGVAHQPYLNVRRPSASVHKVDALHRV